MSAPSTANRSKAGLIDMVTSDPKKEKIQLRPDGWERFDRAVTAAVKSGPKHRGAKKAAKSPNKSDKKISNTRKK
jgi:hypothetical protein